MSSSFFCRLHTKQDLIAVYDFYLRCFEKQAVRVRSRDTNGIKNVKIFYHYLGLNLYESISSYMIENGNELL